MVVAGWRAAVAAVTKRPVMALRPQPLLDLELELDLALAMVVAPFCPGARLPLCAGIDTPFQV